LLWSAHALFPTARWQIAFIAFFLMIAFGYSEWHDKEGQEDRLGDELYYLGLTYTLVSVAHALWAFSGVVDVDRLVSDFSVALLSTLAGIVGRVLLYEKHASRKETFDADEGMARLRNEIEGTVRQMQDFRQGLATYVQQASDNAVQSMNTAFASFSTSAKEISEAAKAMNSSLKKSANAFDKSFSRIGDASEALRMRVSELAEGTKSLVSLSEALTQQAGSLNASLEQQANALSSGLEAQKETIRSLGAELDSLRNPVTLLTGSIDEMRQHVSAATQSFESPELKANIASARDAAKNLSRNLRSVADALSPGSIEANLSALKTFADSVTELTAKVDECARNLDRLGPQAGSPPTVQQLTSAPRDGSAVHGFERPPSNDSALHASSTNDSRQAAPNTVQVGNSTIFPPDPNTSVNTHGTNTADNHEHATESKVGGWRFWRRD